MSAQQHIAILGAGESGVGAALLAKRLGMDVWVSDKGSIAQTFRDELNSAGIPFEENGHDKARILAADLVVKSPGIPNKAPLIQELRNLGKPVMGEIEFAYRNAGPCRIAAVTGTNGKTTTAQLLNHLLNHTGLPSRLAGNVGHAFARLVAEDIEHNRHTDASRVFVLEVSSFQLEDAIDFKPDYALLLNITPDHLDRYDGMLERYAAAKFRITMNQEEGDVFLYNMDNQVAVDYLINHPVSGPGLMGLHQPVLDSGKLSVDTSEYDLSNTALIGPHNAFNAFFALKTAHMMGGDPEKLQEGLNRFVPSPHRMERVGLKDDILYLNDSKATNVEAAYYALSAMDRPVVWIAGGQDKGNDYSMLVPLVEEKVHAIICLGIDNARLRDAFGPLNKSWSEVTTAKDAAIIAKKLARPGDVVLLSPACASFDLFKNFAERGDLFRTAIQQIILSPNNTEHHVTG